MTEFDALDTSDRFAGLRQRAEQLPIPSDVLVSLLDVLGNENTNWKRVESIVRSDPGIASRILSLANSAAFSRGKPVDSLGVACARVGQAALVQTAIAASVGFVDQPFVEGYDIGDRGLWRHSVAMALTADHLARSTGLASPDVAYTAGLLSDVGKLCLGAELQGVDAEGDVPFPIVETMNAGITHQTLGAWMVNRWGLPDVVVLGILRHHDPDPTGPVLPRILHVADFVAALVGGAAGRDTCRYPIDETVVASLSLHNVDELVLEVCGLLHKAEHLLNDKEQSCPAC